MKTDAPRSTPKRKIRPTTLFFNTLTACSIMLFPGGLFSQICSANLEGTQLRKLAAVDGPVRSLAYSPNGSQLVFSALVSGHLRVYLVKSDGKEIRQVSLPDDPDTGSPVFTPDGKQLLVSRDISGLYLINLDGSGARLFKPGALNGAYSSDGSKVLFTRISPDPSLGESNLYIASSDGTSETQIPIPQKGFILHPSFNPKNTSEIVFNIWSSTTAIWVENTDGTHPRSMSPSALYVDSASYDRTGTRIVYSARQLQPASQATIFVRDLSGDRVKQILSLPVTPVEGFSAPVISLPVFSPSEDNISFICGPSVP
jgi:Tol biopolymer transport system component